MNEIFSNAKNILIVWNESVDSGTLASFQATVKENAQQANLECESVENLSKSQHTQSSYDIVLYDLIGNKPTSINLDLLNQCFGLLRPNGYFIASIEHVKNAEVFNHFKMCGFINCNLLDANSSFLNDNKGDDTEKRGSLCSCQKPSFDIGYSVPIRKTGISLIKQISLTGGIRRAWTVENDDDDDEDVLIHTDHGVDEKSSQSCYAGDANRYKGCSSSNVTPFKPGEHINFSTVSDV